MRIEGITDQLQYQPSRVLIAPEHLQTQETPDSRVIRESNDPEEEDTCIVHRKRPRSSATVWVKNTITTPNSNILAVNPSTIANTDKEYLDALNITILSEVVNSHNAEVNAKERRISDKRRYKEEEVKRVVEIAEAYYKAKIKGSMMEKWCNS